jgi:hypothetical protein
MAVSVMANAQEQEGTNTVTSTVTGTTTLDRTPNTATAPSVNINNQDVCTIPATAAIQTQVLGIAGGSAIRDMNCERLKLARSLYAMGMKVAAVSALCQDKRVFQAMNSAGTPCPYDGEIGEEAEKLWEENPEQRPDYEEWKDENEQGNDSGKLFGIGAGALLFILLL